MRLGNCMVRLSAFFASRGRLMDHLIAAFKDFVRSLLWLEQAHDNKLVKAVFQIVAVLCLGAPLATLAGFAGWLKPALPYIGYPAVAYVFWSFARSWERTTGPVIFISKPSVDLHQRIIEVCVENRGSGAVVAR